MGENLSTVFKMGVALITLCATLTVMMFIMVIGRTIEQNTIESVAQLTEEQLIELSDYQHKYVNAEYPAKQLCADMLSMQRQEKATFRKYLN